LFLATGAVYGAYEAATRNYRQVLFSRGDVRGVWPMARHYFFFGPRPAHYGTYNPLQKLAYTTAIGLGLILIVTGAALYKPVQLSGLVWSLGGLRLTRIWHFAAMIGLLGFIPGHLIIVALHGWSNFASMWSGSRRPN
jgi:thiosulfate reductase cytochrome b subunit